MSASLTENHALVAKLLSAHTPEALSEVRERAYQAFSAVGLPTTKDEEFRYVSLRVLEDGGFKPAYGANVDRADAEAAPLGGIDAITVTFVNGEHAPDLSSQDTLPKGVIVGTLADGFAWDQERVLAHLGKVATLQGKLGSTNDERFVHLNTAFLGEGAFVFVPRGVSVERTIHLRFLAKADHGPLAVFPRVLVIMEDASAAKIVESYVGLQGVTFASPVTEVVLGQDAILELTRGQLEGGDSVHVSNTAVQQAGGSTLTHNNLNLGGRIVRHDVNVWLDGEHTETWLNGASVGQKDQVIDNHTRIDHAKPNCHSFETYKSILDDESTGVFNGKIFVYEDAQKTDAKQTNQGLLLSKTATFNTKPQLEIFADDVKCTHGATVGQLREDALFYMRARGVPKEQAEALLVYAFAAEVFEKVTVEDAKDALEALLFERLGTGAV
ncbi:Fe-S cluster assembly protein SufD [bacterium]|nr:MAG: Fe-S cluster assembly protein SufD [bacterium]